MCTLCRRPWIFIAMEDAIERIKLFWDAIKIETIRMQSMIKKMCSSSPFMKNDPLKRVLRFTIHTLLKQNQFTSQSVLYCFYFEAKIVTKTELRHLLLFLVWKASFVMQLLAVSCSIFSSDAKLRAFKSLQTLTGIAKIMNRKMEQEK